MLSFILLLVRRQFKKIQIQTMVNRSSCPEPQMLFFSSVRHQIRHQNTRDSLNGFRFTNMFHLKGSVL